VSYGFPKLIEEEGMTETEFLDEFGLESVMPGICTKCGTVSDRCEPDMRDGWCSECKSQKVKSGLVLLGII
jgi:predicted Zn-ribbon and HTH transcriptional regulator